jgi:hypothetical protein
MSKEEVVELWMDGLRRGVAQDRATTSGTADDDDNRDDEHSGDNEAPVRESDENIEAPEEFNGGNEYDLPSTGDQDDPEDEPGERDQ